MESRQIRSAFLEYFRKQAHEVVRSSPLVPFDDPTLLFTNAGMVQFKGVFLGQEQRPYKRATSCQKCMRAGGKHSDLENVGHTARHHTFFEMLGNFSFGDYFKQEAIRFAWQLLTEWFKLPKHKLWVSVYEEDDEAEQLWKEQTDVDPDKIVRLGAKDNFWQMGDTGPCGPCSEIIIDQGEEVGCGRADCNVECDCDRYLELWNLVFMQYNRNPDGSLEPLPKPSIDTGMGLERITAVLQGKHSNFDTDLFMPIIQAAGTIAGRTYGETDRTDVSLRVIADHVRAAVFLLSEGLVPSNEGRGYVLRRIIRRASRHGRLLGLERPFLFEVADAVVDVMGQVYPEITDEIDRTKTLLRIEEEKFGRTLEVGLQKMEELIRQARNDSSDKIPGEEVFRLYDTYGFPLDLARDIAHDEGLQIDEEGFHRAMQAQRQQARARAFSTEDILSRGVYAEIAKAFGSTEFLGYEKLQTEAKVLAILKQTNRVSRAEAPEEVELVLDRTVFYGESGGQVGDTGWADSDDAHLEVIDTKKLLDGLIVHHVRIKRGTVSEGDTLKLRVDEDKRRATMKNHTATHLLHRALKIVLGEHVKQAGSLVAPDRLRFDFTHYQAVTEDELRAVEKIVNEKIQEAMPVVVEEMGLEEAIQSGAVALFDEKYSERVRVVSCGQFSKELCGGTHCTNTGQIGVFLILSEGSVASGIRRIEATTGMTAIEYIGALRHRWNTLKQELKAEEPVERVRALQEEVRSLKKEIEQLKTAGPGQDLDEVVRSAKEVNGIKLVSVFRQGLNHREMRLLGDRIKDKLGSGVVFICSEQAGEALFVCLVTKDLADRVHAGQVLRAFAEASGGRGGGKETMAQGGTKSPDRARKALERLPEILEEALKVSA